jgi:hypothetical protein
MSALRLSAPRVDRLFHVLVVVGAASCADDDGTSQRDLTIDAPAPSDDATAAADATPSGDGAALDPCFCDVSVCCDRSATPAVLAPGFECCWSTTCP